MFNYSLVITKSIKQEDGRKWFLVICYTNTILLLLTVQASRNNNYY